jgi:LysM repeat protein
MKVLNLIKVLPVMIFLLVLNNTVCSQVLVERSKDKAIISGIPYYVHLVKKGETSYSISKAYGITVEELIRENPSAVKGIKDGQTLMIPVKMVISGIQSESLPVRRARDENNFIYHSLKPGETVYFLSKSYGVSENEIVLGNPGIDINKLSIGSEIAIPRREFMNNKQQFNNLDKRYILHEVQKGESLSSIAEKYGLTVRALRKENRDMRFPQVGDFIKVPGIQIADIKVIEPPGQDTVVKIAEEPVTRLERPAEFTEIKELKGSLDVAVLLPFYLKENSGRKEIDSSGVVKGNKIINVIEHDEDWIYPQSLDFVEMYEGILLAADTLSSLGLDINLYPYDIKKDTIEITKLIESGKLATMDLIIGPVYSRNLTAVASYTKDLGIPVVSPVPLLSNSALTGNPTLFLTSSSLEIAQKAIAKKVSEYYDYSFVFIHSDTLGIDTDVKRFKDLILKELSYKLPFEEIRFKELPFYSRSMFDNDSINRLSHALSEKTKNIVIIASEDAPVISETIMDIHGLSRRFDVTVFGYPVLRELDNLEPKYFFDLDISIYSPSWIDYSNMDVIQFNSGFLKKFLTEPTPMSYAWQGYDMAYFFLSGLAVMGKNFIVHPESHYPDLLQTEYDFVRKNAGDGFENQKLFLIRYTRDYEVRLVEGNELVNQK